MAVEKFVADYPGVTIMIIGVLFAALSTLSATHKASPATADGQYTLSWGGSSGTVGKRYRGIKYTEN